MHKKITKRYSSKPLTHPSSFMTDSSHGDINECICRSYRERQSCCSRTSLEMMFQAHSNKALPAMDQIIRTERDVPYPAHADTYAYPCNPHRKTSVSLCGRLQVS